MIANAVLIFFTASDVKVAGKSYRYDDTLLDDGRVLEFFSQKHWTTGDAFLQDQSKDIYVFGRLTNKLPFKYVGKVIGREVITERTAKDTLQMRFTVDANNADICSPHQVFPAIPAAGMGKYKLGVIYSLPVSPTQGNATSVGIVPVVRFP